MLRFQSQLFTALLLVLVTAPSLAAPTQIQYQGYLQESDVPFSGNINLVLQIFDSASGGNPLWGPEEHFAVDVQDGVFSVPMGSAVALSPEVFGGANCWVQVTVNGNVLTPRTALLTVPYSFRAVVADSAIVSGGAGGSDSPWIQNGTSINYNLGKVGIGTSTPPWDLSIFGDGAALGLATISETGQVPFFHMRNMITGDDWIFRHDGTRLHVQTEYADGHEIMTLWSNGRVGIGTTSPTERLDVAGSAHMDNLYLGDGSGIEGRIRCNVVEILGGADLSEPFPIKSSMTVLPGMVVSIDPTGSGELIPCSREYDSKVAGIISGANGIQPGLTMRQEGALSGSHQVALTGRVYALCDADFNPIVPGDLLTTSGTSGHAMKVRNMDAAHGAVIGKAMTSLDKGRGLVLVLVTLQ